MDPGTLVDGKYELIKQLGEGGMGSVHEARHVGTGRRVAVKLITPDALLKSPDIGARFEREARATGHLESGHVAQVLDTGRDAATNRPYLVMELLRGEDLSQAVQRLGPLPPDTALRIIAQALTGLQKAHEAGIVHRDIKPANVFLSHGGTDGVLVKILDFGIAKVRADPLSAERREDVALTRTGSMLGSPLYMSPEQARSAKNLDHRCDLWAMGVCLYEALSGFTPYGDVDTLGGLILEICAGHPRNVQDRAPWVSAEIARIVHRALHPAIEHRFQNAQEMLADIRTQIASVPGIGPISVTPAMVTSISPDVHAHVAAKLAVSGSGVSPYAMTEGSRPSLPQAAISQSIPGASSTSPELGQPKRFPIAATLGILGVLVVGGAVAARFAFNRKSESPAQTTVQASTAVAAALPAADPPATSALPSAAVVSAAPSTSASTHVQIAARPTVTAHVTASSKPTSTGPPPKPSSSGEADRKFE